MIRLYGMGSPNVVKIMIMLEELEYDYTIERIDVVAGDQHTEAFHALNPNRKVPVLVDDSCGREVVVFESGAILIHLAEVAGRFLATSGAARATALQWLFFQTSAAGPSFGQAIHFSFATRQAGYARDRFYTEMCRLIRVIEGRLVASSYLAGPDYSVADIALWPWIRTLRNYFPKELDFPAIRNWFTKIQERCAVDRALSHAAKQAILDKAALKGASTTQLDRYFGRTTNEQS